MKLHKDIDEMKSVEGGLIKRGKGCEILIGRKIELKILRSDSKIIQKCQTNIQGKTL